MHLSQWQAELQHSILLRQDAISLPVKVGAIPKATRLGLYQDAYVLRLEEALRTNYPVMHQLLGDDDFTALHGLYVQAHPSQHASIRWYGQALADFLRITPPYSAVPLFAEMAQFEWALRHTIDALAAQPLTLSDLQQIPPEQWGGLRFSLLPSLTLFDLQWNTLPVWRAINAEEIPPEPEHAPAAWLVWRDEEGMSQWRSADIREYNALVAVQRHSTFAELCETVAPFCTTSEETPQVVAQYLHGWIAQGLLSAISL